MQVIEQTDQLHMNMVNESPPSDEEKMEIKESKRHRKLNYNTLQEQARINTTTWWNQLAFYFCKSNSLSFESFPTWSDWKKEYPIPNENWEFYWYNGLRPGTIPVDPRFISSTTSIDSDFSHIRTGPVPDPIFISSGSSSI